MLYIFDLDNVIVDIDFKRGIDVLHTEYWLPEYPEIAAASNRLYLSQQIGMRKPETEIYRYLLEQEGIEAQQAIFFDDNAANIDAARALGIQAIQVIDRDTIPTYFI